MADLPDTEPIDPAVERRLSEAFRALATAEVPTSTPRPQRAPRPVAPARGSRRRRYQIAGGSLLAVAAAVVIALVVGTEVNDARVGTHAPPATGSTTAPPTPTTSTPTTSAPTTPPPSTPTSPATNGTPATYQQVTAAFAAVAGPHRTDVLAVPGGYEAAETEAGTIRFWRWNGTAWAVDGTSTYPADVRGDNQVTYQGEIAASSVLSGMQHATFLVRGGFSGDSTANVIVYTDGPDGWGVVKAGTDGDLHPSGAPLTADRFGLMFEGGLVDGMLQTVDCSRSVPDMASCGLPQYQVTKYWTWSGDRFVLDHRTGPAS